MARPWEDQRGVLQETPLRGSFVLGRYKSPWSMDSEDRGGWSPVSPTHNGVSLGSSPPNMRHMKADITGGGGHNSVYCLERDINKML